MLAFILRRLLQAVVVMLTVAFIAFMLFQYVGDPVTNLLGQDATPEQRNQLRADLGLDQPFPMQFAAFVANAVQGELGLSLRQGRKVASLLVERFPATLELATCGILIGAGLGIPLGVWAAVRRGGWVDQSVRVLGLAGYSVPIFWLGLMALVLFYAKLGWVGGPGRIDVGARALRARDGAGVDVQGAALVDRVADRGGDGPGGGGPGAPARQLLRQHGAEGAAELPPADGRTGAGDRRAGFRRGVLCGSRCGCTGPW